MPYRSETNTDNDDSDFDPGREVIERNARARLQRVANHTRDELNKVLQRVDHTLYNYENSVQSSLVQHGMTHQDLANVELVADIKELENLLNDSIAKQKYKQRLMVFIVGHSEQMIEKDKLLQQIEHFFSEQKQSFSAKEFNDYDERPDQLDEVDLTLRSFDIKDCYSHVKSLGTRLNELNDEIIQHLIQTAATKQTKGKKKGVQMTKEIKDQLTNLQTKLDAANAEIVGKQSRIDELEEQLLGLTEEIQKNEEERTKFESTINRYENQVESLKLRTTELEESIEQYQDQIDEFRRNKSNLPKESDAQDVTEIVEEKKEETTVEEEKMTPTSQSMKNFDENHDELQLILPDSVEPSANLNAIFNPPPGIDLHQVTRENLPLQYANLREYAILRVRELLKELELQEFDANNSNPQLRKEFDDFKIAHEKERHALIELADNAYKLQMKAQKTAEEAMNHLKIYMAEQEGMKNNVIDGETQTDLIEEFERTPLLHNTPVPSGGIEETSAEHFSAQSKVLSDDLEPTDRPRKESLKEKYLSLLEEKQNELEHLKQLAEMVLSRPATSTDEITTVQDFESLTGVDSAIKQDEEQQTSAVEEKTKDSAETTFFSFYELIFKFRHAFSNVLEQNHFSTFAERLQSFKQMSTDDHYENQTYLDNAENLLKEMVKIVQTSMAVFSSKITEFETKQRDQPKVLSLTDDKSSVDSQQTTLIDEKDSKIKDLTAKYKQLADLYSQATSQHDTEILQNQSLVLDQHKYIDTLQQEISRLQKRLTKLENDGVVEPSILFTRLDAERNERTLRKAVDSGKVPENLYDEINEGMKDYVNLPARQLSHLVKRYVQHRQASDLENRIQSEVDDHQTRSVLQKMEALHERRSAQIGQRMSSVRQYRVDLAKSLTEKIDHLEDNSDVFLVRPIYSCHGRAAAKSYIANVRRKRELPPSRSNSHQHLPSRQSSNPQHEPQHAIPVIFASVRHSNEDDRMFHIEQSFTDPSQSLTTSQDPSTSVLSQNTRQFGELSRLQEIDFQRTLMPMSHTTTSLLSAFTNNVVDPYVPSLNLRSYVALSRPGVGHVRRAKANEMLTPMSREALSAMSVKSQGINPRTPFNSGAAARRRTSPTLPPIKRQISPTLTTVIDDKSMIDIIPTTTTTTEAVPAN